MPRRGIASSVTIGAVRRAQTRAPPVALAALPAPQRWRRPLLPVVPAQKMAIRSVHAEATGGFGGSNASLYERSRPSYPVDALRAIEAEICRSGTGDGTASSSRSGEPLLVVDLGCGTGKFTREILPFCRSEGLSLVGIEPVEAMRKQFEEALPEVRVLEGTGESIPIPGSGARAVIAAQSFHWMSSSATLREVHRVLVPGGVFVLVWNTRDASTPWVRALEDIIDPFYGHDVPRQHGGPWRQSFQDLENESTKEGASNSSDGERLPSFFGEIAEQHFRHSQLLTPDELDERMRSISVIATRPEHERVEASRRARELVETHPDTRNVVRESGRVELTYDTEVYWTHKLVSPCSS